MPKDKAEIVNQRKNKLSNVTTTPKAPISTRPKKDEVKKIREPSTDRSNIKKNITVDKKSELVSSRISDASKTKTTNKVNVSKPKLKTSITEKQTSSNITPGRTSVSKPVIKPVKATNSTITGTKSSARDVTSKRVTKEQFFPKKFPYSSYLHENGDQIKNNKIVQKKSQEQLKVKPKDEKVDNPVPPMKLSRAKTMTRILNPNEVQIPLVKSEEINKIERPRTATIQNSENDNESLPHISSNEENEISNDYEDDFESYESDFESYSSNSSTSSSDSLSIETDNSSSENTSSSSERMIEFSQKRANSAGTEEERKLDSGNYDLPDVKHKQMLDNIKEAIEKENSDLNNRIRNENVNSLASFSDEGFEDGSKHIQVSGFANFMDAKKKQQKKKINLKSRKRGDDLMNMIRLNSINFSLFDMTAITYEDFMQSYGRSGTLQMSSQTGYDDLDEEIQTDNIEMIDKFTQFPNKFSDIKLEQTIDESKVVEIVKTKELNTFLETTGRLVLQVLEQKQNRTEKQIIPNLIEIPFSDGYIDLNFDKTNFLKNRNITFIIYSKYSSLLTVHESNIQVYMNQNDQLLSRATICIWDLEEVTYPHNILVSSGEITKACFDNNHGYLIFAGINDGSISVWDLRESSNLHRNIYDEQIDNYHVMRSATYTAIATIDNESCSEKNVAIQSYYTYLTQNDSEFSDTQNISGTQVCTLTETGTIIIWSVIQKQATPELLSEDQRLVPWGSVILVQGLVISLQNINPNLKELQCFDLQLHEAESNHLFIASNYGVLHCLTSGMKPKPKLYSITDKSQITCVEMAQFSSTYFLSGCENGNIKLHSRFYEKPLMTLSVVEEIVKINAKVQIIEWSNIRPCVFFVKDSANFIHVWDLRSSDMYPIYSINFSENISDIKLSPVCRNKENDPCYMAIASKDYGVRLHKMSKEFFQITPEQYKTELNTFLNYANRL